MNNYSFPTIGRRCLSILIDNMISLLTIVLCFKILQLFFTLSNKNTTLLLVCSAIYIILIPLLTSTCCTPGQLITGIRVRSYRTGTKISFLSSMTRFAVKILFGFVSFISIFFNRKNRPFTTMLPDQLLLKYNFSKIIESFKTILKNIFSE